MKSQSLQWSSITTGSHHRDTLPVNSSFSLPGKYFVAALVALGIVFGAASAISSPVTTSVAQAIAWTLALVFLAFSVESSSKSFTRWSLATGLALPVLALMSAMVASGFLVLAAVVVAAWITMAIIREEIE